MSEIAILEKLEPFLAQAAPVAPAATVQVSSLPVNGHQGSQLELFFSEVRYATFVAKKKPTVKLQESSAGTSGASLKYSLKLH